MSLTWAVQLDLLSKLKVKGLRIYLSAKVLDSVPRRPERKRDKGTGVIAGGGERGEKEKDRDKQQVLMGSG